MMNRGDLCNLGGGGGRDGYVERNERVGGGFYLYFFCCGHTGHPLAPHVSLSLDTVSSLSRKQCLDRVEQARAPKLSYGEAWSRFESSRAECDKLTNEWTLFVSIVPHLVARFFFTGNHWAGSHPSPCRIFHSDSARPAARTNAGRCFFPAPPTLPPLGGGPANAIPYVTMSFCVALYQYVVVLYRLDLNFFLFCQL